MFLEDRDSIYPCSYHALFWVKIVKTNACKVNFKTPLNAVSSSPQVTLRNFVV